MQAMPKPLTADDIIPLVASLTPQERVRLLRLIALPQGADAPVYRSVPPSRDEFVSFRQACAIKEIRRSGGEIRRLSKVLPVVPGHPARGRLRQLARMPQ